jgi:hypothetical protein
MSDTRTYEDIALNAAKEARTLIAMRTGREQFNEERCTAAITVLIDFAILSAIMGMPPGQFVMPGQPALTH